MPGQGKNCNEIGRDPLSVPRAEEPIIGVRLADVSVSVELVAAIRALSEHLGIDLLVGRVQVAQRPTADLPSLSPPCKSMNMIRPVVRPAQYLACRWRSRQWAHIQS